VNEESLHHFPECIQENDDALLRSLNGFRETNDALLVCMKVFTKTATISSIAAMFSSFAAM